MVEKTDDTNQLILKAQAGDGDAETALLKQYSKLVKSVAFSYYIACGDRDREDLVQEGMIALMRAVRTFSPSEDASFETYATCCVRNAIIDEIRKAPQPSLPIDNAVNDPAPSQTLLVDLAEAIASALTPIEMKVLELRLDTMSYDEIAKELGIQKKKVDNIIFSAKRKLKKALGGQ